MLNKIWKDAAEMNANNMELALQRQTKIKKTFVDKLFGRKGKAVCKRCGSDVHIRYYRFMLFQDVQCEHCGLLERVDNVQAKIGD